MAIRRRHLGISSAPSSISAWVIAVVNKLAEDCIASHAMTFCSGAGLYSSERMLVSRMIIRQSQAARASARGAGWKAPHHQLQQHGGESTRPSWLLYLPSVRGPLSRSRELLLPWNGHVAKPGRGVVP